MRRLLIILAALLVAGTAWGVWRQYVFNLLKVAHHVNVAEYESDMTEALARQIFKDLQKDKPLAYFLAFGEDMTAPSRSFLARFDNVRPPVKNYQSAVMPPTGLIIDTATGRVGAIVQIVKIKQVITGEYNVEVAINKAGPGKGRFVYRVSEFGGEWRVKSCKPA
jgi:hypothetical protein